MLHFRLLLPLRHYAAFDAACHAAAAAAGTLTLMPRHYADADASFMPALY